MRRKFVLAGIIGCFLGVAYILYGRILTPPRVYPQPKGPPIAVIGAKYSPGLISLSLPSGEWHTGVGVHLLASEYIGQSVGPGAARNAKYTAPVERDSSHYALQQWRINPKRPWKVTGKILLDVPSVQTIACSPNGQLSAFWTRTKGQRQLFIADWKTRKTRHMADLPGDIDGKLELACSDDGTVYVGDRSWTRYQGNGKTSSAGGFEQIITSKAGTFGVNSQQEGDTITFSLTALNNPAAPTKRFSVDCGRIFNRYFDFPFPCRFTAGHLISSDDGQWWGAATAQFVHFGSARAFVVWRDGRTEPYYVHKDYRLKAFIPVGLEALP